MLVCECGQSMSNSEVICDTRHEEAPTEHAGAYGREFFKFHHNGPSFIDDIAMPKCV